MVLYTHSSENGMDIIYNDVTSLRGSDYRYSKPSVIIIHGYLGNEQSYVNTQLRRGYISNFNVNVLVCDWSVGAEVLTYSQAIENAFRVAKFIAKFLDFLYENNGFNYSMLTIVGHELGAHVAGLIGKNVKKGKIYRIIGLDPAGPEFKNSDPSNRLASTDASYVESIHTDNVMGIHQNISQADFFINNGRHQPGCFQDHPCSNLRSIDILLESLNSTKLVGRKCQSLGDIFRKVKCNGVAGYLGGNPYLKTINENGVYQVYTKSKPPYGKS